MGLPVPGQSVVLGDNQSVIFETSQPESTLRKKNNSICYHVVRESVAMGTILTGRVPLKLNIADLLTKVSFGSLRRTLLGRIVEDIYDTFPSQ